jgi:hypothetical protein
MRKRTLLPLLILGCLNSLNAQEVNGQAASEKEPPVRFLIRGAMELGGDKITEVYFTNGNKQSVRTGQGVSLGVGAQVQVPGAERLLFHATVGIKYVTTEADNAHIRLTRVPVLLTANWMAAKKLRLGAGLAMHRGIRFKADGIGEDLKFHPASGPVFEVAYSGIGLSYTAMKYKDEYDYTYSANAIGLTFTGVIRGKKK